MKSLAEPCFSRRCFIGLSILILNLSSNIWLIIEIFRFIFLALIQFLLMRSRQMRYFLFDESLFGTFCEAGVVILLEGKIIVLRFRHIRVRFEMVVLVKWITSFLACLRAALKIVTASSCSIHVLKNRVWMYHSV